MATQKRNYNMTDATDKWVKLRGNGTVYASESEYIRALVIRDMEQHGETEVIRAAIMQGENSGMSDKTPEEIKQAVLKRKKLA
jgi:antitoxin ParD1/3/4